MIDDGGPAFPGDSAQCGPQFGMSLRDYFAIHATDADIAGQIYKLTLDETTVLRHHLRAHARYMHADSMLAARKGVKP